MRTPDLKDLTATLASLKASVTDNSAVSMEYLVLELDWLESRRRGFGKEIPLPLPVRYVSMSISTSLSLPLVLQRAAIVNKLRVNHSRPF